MNKKVVGLSLVLAFYVTHLAGCSSDNNALLLLPQPPAPLSAVNLNLIFVVSPDLAFHAAGDINSDTANLTTQGLNRSLLMATFLQQVLGSKNVTGIYTLQPMSHTQNSFPDMAPLVNVQQFAMLNQITLLGQGSGQPPHTTGNSYPLNVSYVKGAIPANAITIPPSGICPDCQGLAFNDPGSNNSALVTTIINSKTPGFHVFSAPWETINALLVSINSSKEYHLTLPATFVPNQIYVVSIAPSGSASLITFDPQLNPSVTYPDIPGMSSLMGTATCPDTTTKTPAGFEVYVTATTPGAVIPADINRNETLYMIRHAEAHPASGWEDGNYVAAGQWRALALPLALHEKKISPDQVYSIDPAQLVEPSSSTPNWSYVRPSLTVAPYVIANNLPFYLISTIELTNPISPKLTSNYFFFENNSLAGKTVLLAWEHDHIPLIVFELIKKYFPHGGGPTPAPPLTWPGSDYDTIWTVKTDAAGNLTVHNHLCEGIDSAKLPATPPRF